MSNELKFEARKAKDSAIIAENDGPWGAWGCRRRGRGDADAVGRGPWGAAVELRLFVVFRRRQSGGDGVSFIHFLQLFFA